MSRLSARKLFGFSSIGFLAFALVLMAFSLPSVTTYAQSECPSQTTDLEYGETVTGSIEKGKPAIIYCVEVSEGDELVVEMTATSGDLDTFLAITTVDAEEVLATNDDVESGTSDSRIEFEATFSGEILVMATRFEFADGTSTGDFELTLECGNCSTGKGTDTDKAANECPEDFNVIEYNEEITGEITDDEYFVFFCFNGSEGDELTIDVHATSGDLDTRLFLTDVEVTETLAENDDRESGNTDSLIEFTLEEDGAYLVAVGRYEGEEGTSEGEFELIIDGPEDTKVAGGECGEPPMSDLVAGSWVIETDELSLEMEFDCDGTVVVTFNGNTDTYDYEFDQDALTITIPELNILFENVIVVEGIMMTTIGEDETPLFFINSDIELEPTPSK